MTWTPVPIPPTPVPIPPTPVPIPPTRDAWATAYGFVLDHIWAAPETNAARRPHWPEDMYVVVLPCTDLDPPTEESEGADHWVFFENGLEYVPSEPKPQKEPETLADLIALATAEVAPVPPGGIVPDLVATDWLVGRV